MRAPEPTRAPSGPVVVVGAGYAGLATAQGIARRSRGKLPVVLVDRHPVHVLRTELYDIGRLARAAGDPGPWTVPLARALERSSVEFRTGEVRAIDLDARALELDSGRLPFGQLVIGLGSVAAYYGVPGAAENTHQVYRLSGAQRLAAAIRDVEQRSGSLPAERRPRFIIVGGGSTATELAAEIAATDWAAIVGSGARAPEVLMLTGALPFLAGFPPTVVARARRVLRRRGVVLLEGLNATRVDPGRLSIADGSILAFDLAVWCAGLEAPPVVRALPVPHGRAGRVRVAPTLEVPDRPGVFAVGDVIELTDPASGAPVPGNAAAALAEGEVAAANAVARWTGRPLVEFRYRERGVVVALGSGSAAGSVRHVTVWGSPAALLKRLVQRDYSASVTRGEPPHLA
jgi:NADH:ubiquinone reductase (H+-translocating)